MSDRDLFGYVFLALAVVSLIAFCYVARAARRRIVGRSDVKTPTG